MLNDYRKHVHPLWVAFVTLNDRLKSIHNRCVIEVLVAFVCCHDAVLFFCCGCRRLCHRTESDLFLLLFWPSARDFQSDPTFHQFHHLALHLPYNVGFYEELHRVWHASRDCWPFRTPGAITLWDLLMLQLWDHFSRTCHAFSWLFTLNIHRYYLYFALYKFNIIYQ